MDKLTELKAKAYDLLAQRAYIDQQIQAVNAEIAKEAQGRTQGEVKTEENGHKRRRGVREKATQA